MLLGVPLAAFLSERNGGMNDSPDPATRLHDGVGVALVQRGVSRRDFLRFCSVMTAA
jgi:hypothetical protein